MTQRQFGRTDMRVSPLGFGAMELKRIDERESERLLHRVLDEGINYIDTSPDYKTSEEKIGKALRRRRGEFYLASKCGCNPHLDRPGSRHVHTWDAATLRRNIESSLSLLKTDYLDVWQLHGALPDQLEGGVAGEVVQTMFEMKREGKVRYIGASLRHGPKTEEGYPTAHGFRCIREYETWGVFDMVQIVYGGMARTSEEAIRGAAEKGLAVVIRGMVRDYRPDFDELFSRVGLSECTEDGEDRRSFLIRYALTHPAVAVGILGTSKEEHLLSNLRATRRGPLPPDVYEETQRRLARIDIAPGGYGPPPGGP